MKNDFEKGFHFFQDNASVSPAIAISTEYIGKIENEISEFVETINKYSENNLDIQQLKGFFAETWHAGTFNIDAALKKSSNRAYVDIENRIGYASADIGTNFGKSAGLKYCANAKGSAHQQSLNHFEKFQKYHASGGKCTMKEYFAKNRISPEQAFEPIYKGQIRIIPEDQYDAAVDFLKQSIEKCNNPEKAQGLKETLNMLSTALSDGKGNRSLPLSKLDSEVKTEIAKLGNATAENMGVTIEDMIKFEHILRHSLQAGLSTLAISAILKIGPEIYKSIDYLIKKGMISEEQFKSIGFAALSGSSEGFIRGSVTAALTTACVSGMMGESLKQAIVNSLTQTTISGVIAALVVVTIDAFKLSFNVVQGKITQYEMKNEMLKKLFISALSLGIGTGAQILLKIPAIPFLIGSFVGSIAGEFIYNGMHKATLSLCANSGFTMFGLVEQDYTLPDDIIESLGLDSFEYDQFEYDEFKNDEFDIDELQLDEFDYDEFEYNTFDTKILRRGVIGVSKIGYSLI